MNIWSFITGTLQIEIVSAEPVKLLSAINEIGIILYDVELTDPVTVRLKVERNDYKDILHLANSRGEKISVICRSGIYWNVKKALKRPILCAFFICFLILTAILPTRVLVIRVVGNNTVPAQQIIDAAADCGIYIGAPRKEIRSEKVKNTLIAELPQLQWVGVNSSGCVATIKVEEKSVINTDEDTASVSSIIAERDGVICDLTVLQGTPICQIGQVVKKGQVLVSGYTDCGITIKATQAKAEVFANTHHKITFVTPKVSSCRGKIVHVQRRYSLRIGKKLINFFYNSGILDSSCVKMYEQKYLTLPGGYQLPVALICQKWISYEESSVVSATEDCGWLEQYGAEYLKEQMLAGKILQADYTSESGADTHVLHGEYVCVEMIGQVKNEESLQIDGKDG